MRLMSEGLRAVTWLSSEVCVLKDHGIPISRFSFDLPGVSRPIIFLSSLPAVIQAAR